MDGDLRHDGDPAIRRSGETPSSSVTPIRRRRKLRDSLCVHEIKLTSPPSAPSPRTGGKKSASASNHPTSTAKEQAAFAGLGFGVTKMRASRRGARSRRRSPTPRRIRSDARGGARAQAVSAPWDGQADRGPQHSHVGRRRCAEARDHEPAVVQLVRAQLGQYAGDLGGNAAGSRLQSKWISSKRRSARRMIERLRLHAPESGAHGFRMGIVPRSCPVFPVMDTGCRCTEHHHFPRHARCRIPRCDAAPTPAAGHPVTAILRTMSSLAGTPGSA